MIRIAEHYFHFTLPIWIFLVLIYVIIIRRLFLYILDRIKAGKSVKIYKTVLSYLTSIGVVVLLAYLVDYLGSPGWAYVAIGFVSIYLWVQFR